MVVILRYIQFIILVLTMREEGEERVMHCTLALLYFNNNYKSTTAQCRHSQEKVLDIPACAQE